MSLNWLFEHVLFKKKTYSKTCKIFKIKTHLLIFVKLLKYPYKNENWKCTKDIQSVKHKQTINTWVANYIKIKETIKVE